MPWLLLGAMAICLGLLTRSATYTSAYRRYWNKVGSKGITDSVASRWIPPVLLVLGGLLMLVGLISLALR